MTLAALLLSLAAVQDLPAHPDQLTFPPLTFEPPVAADFRTELSGGVPCYLAPSHEFPLITVTFQFRGGPWLDRKTGQSQFTGAMIRQGGSAGQAPEALDEAFDFLAAEVSTSASAASLDCLAQSFEEAFALFLDMLRHPRFDPARMEVLRGQYLAAMGQRNDDAGSLLRREWDFLLYGQEHFLGRVPTEASLGSLTPDDLRAYHRQVFQPGNLIVWATGDFEPAAMKARLEQALEGWERGERQPPPPAPAQTVAPGVYHVQKDIPQGKVQMGLRSVPRDHRDHHALLLLDSILGSSGFTSRIVARVRSDEGLAYSAGSSLSMPAWYPGEFDAFFQSKNRTVALAIQVILEEMRRIREEPVSEQELMTAKSGFVETFPRRFASKQAILSTFVDDEWSGRDPEYWRTFRDRIQAVTAADVQRVAREHLRPEDLAILVVGNWDEIAPGDPEGRASMAEFFGGEVTHLPARDPLSMEPVSGAGS